MNDQRKLRIPFPIVVEGKYDRLKLLSVCDAQIITTDGFGIFKKNEKLALIRKLGSASQIILLTDSDGAGKLIRSHISSALPKDQVVHLYIPSIEGKERRKKVGGAEGLLGVEGMEAERLRAIFAPFATHGSPETKKSRPVEKRDFYADGLSGGAGASEKRERLARAFDLPRGMTANALLEAINLLFDYETYQRTLASLDGE